ncbi:MAG: GNAT family N-acetyltransferase [Flavisolibacter sp.]
MVPQLTTERLSLVPITLSDQAFIFEGLSHPEVIRYYGVRYDSYEGTHTQMIWYDQMVQDSTGIPWKIMNKATGEEIGVIAVYFYKPEHRKAEIGFWILPQYQKKGYASEAIAAVIHYWKNVKGLHRMEAFVEEGNEASSRLLEKSGFSYEGLMKDCEIKDEKFISLMIYGLVSQ